MLGIYFKKLHKAVDRARMLESQTKMADFRLEPEYNAIAVPIGMKDIKEIDLSPLAFEIDEFEMERSKHEFTINLFSPITEIHSAVLGNVKVPEVDFLYACAEDGMMINYHTLKSEKTGLFMRELRRDTDGCFYMERPREGKILSLDKIVFEPLEGGAIEDPLMVNFRNGAVFMVSPQGIEEVGDYNRKHAELLKIIGRQNFKYNTLQARELSTTSPIKYELPDEPLETIKTSDHDYFRFISDLYRNAITSDI